MANTYPKITHLSQVREAIEGREEFTINDRPWGSVALYNVGFIDTWTDGDDLTQALRRECRGIKFNPRGEIIARPYHKFFNLNEREETQANVIDWSAPFGILEKLDGSMIHTIIHDDTTVYMTKAGISDTALQAQAYADAIPKYELFARECWKLRLTPLFEWTSPANRIVVAYKDSALTLTALRDTVSGEYVPYTSMLSIGETWGIPVVKEWEGTFANISDFADAAVEEEDNEGYIFRWNSKMIKIKNLWYVTIHKAKELILFEKDTWALVLDHSIDDVIAFLPEDDQKIITEFSDVFWHTVDEVAKDLTDQVDTFVADHNPTWDAKTFAVDFVNNKDNGFTGFEKIILFRIFAGDAASDQIIKLVGKYLSTGTRLDSMRDGLMRGIKWNRP